MSKKIFVISFFLMLSFSELYSQTVINANSGNQYIGIVMNRENNFITLKTLEGVIVNIPNSDIQDQYRVFTNIITKYGYEYSGTLSDFNDSSYTIVNGKSRYDIPRKITDRLKIVTPGGNTLTFENLSDENNVSYSSLNLGMGLCIIGSASFMIGYDYNKIGTRLTLGIIPISDEHNIDIRLSCSYNLGRTDTFEHNLSLGFGFLDAEPYDFCTYTGLFYDISLSVFFLEAGTFIPNDDDEHSDMLIQFGWKYRF